MTAPTIERGRGRTEDDPTAVPTRRRVSLTRPHHVFAWVLIAPAVVLFVFVFVIPIVYSGGLSLMGTAAGASAYGVREEVFVGLGNYTKVLQDPTFWTSLGNLAVYALFLVPIMMLTAMLFALLLDLPRARLRAFSRMAIFLPYGVPSVIAALMWGFLYVPEISPIYQLADTFGLQFPTLLRGDLVMTAIINVVLWGGIGFNTIILYTSLQSLPKEQIDAARIDGCNEPRIAWYIKLPHIVPATILTGLFSIIGALQVYSEPQMLSSLTPAISSTYFPLMRVYRDAFAHDDLNSASAASIILALATVLLSLLVLGGQRLAARRNA